MYRLPIHKRYRIGNLPCIECYKITNRPVKQFDTQRALSLHLVHVHDLPKDELNKIKIIVKEYLNQQNEKSFIEFCFERGLLY